MQPPKLRALCAALLLLVGCSGDPKDLGTTHVDPDDTGRETGGDPDSDTDSGDVPSASPGEPWLRSETRAPGSVTFNELYYHPAAEGEAEWIELRNPMALDMDLSGWSLEGGVDFTFEAGTVIEAGGYLVIASDPAAISGAVGPFEGALSDGGERVTLRSSSGRLIDTLSYGDDDPWPVQADGSGVTLAKTDPDLASDHAESWTFSAELGGTPGASNALDPDAPATTLELLAIDATWTYDLSGEYPDADWADPAYDDGAWSSGEAVFYAGGAVDDALATIWATADNYYGLYLGQADGADLRLVGEDPDGNWTTVDGFDVELTALDHLYIAAWEAPGDSYSPQMTIAEIELPDAVVGTDADGWEWVLGPTDGFPGLPPTDPPPDEDEILGLIEDAEATGGWAAPGDDAAASADPWGWATSAWFSGDTRFIWADTFDSASITNTENTYALFRSAEPLLGPSGSTELPDVPTTITFRATFTLDADPDATTLSARCELDDGAVFYLNGVEVHRENMPDGAVSASTLASAPVTDDAEIYAELSTAALVRGLNTLAVEVHQAETDDDDMRFGCALSARVSAETREEHVLFDEIAPASASTFWVDLLGASDGEEDTTGLILASAGGERVLPAGALGPGERLTVEDLGFPVEAGDVLFLYAADRGSLLDAVRVGEGLRGRDEDGGPWRYPSEPTPGEPNLIELTDAVVINEIQYHHAPRSVDGEPLTDDDEEWIELYNRGDAPVDLSGWQLVDAVAFTFPDGAQIEAGGFLVVTGDSAGFAAAHPEVTALGDWSGRLDNQSDRILLLDARGNPADEVRYYDGGRWPVEADGDGATLELRDPAADNLAGEAWAASALGDNSEWISVSYRGVAGSSAVGPDGTWEELVLGLLDRGELLLDDLSVVRDPDGAAVELLRNGTFDDDDARWRLLGNHRHSEIAADPDDPSNPVLRLVATGQTGHMHNHAETTLKEAVRSTSEYQISYRARWISGNNQLNSRLYFNRLAQTTRIQRPESAGTPGAANGGLEENVGPTFADLAQDVAVPQPFEDVGVSVSVADPDGVAAVTLYSSVEGADFQAQAMTEVEPGVWRGTLEGQEAGALVQLYVSAEDGLGATASFPAAGPDSRALLRFDDGEAETNGLHNLRILLTPDDSDWLHDDINLMSDDLVGATVVYDESKVFYDVGVRAKGSERGRPETARLGYGLRFRPDQPFRGSHLSALVDRSEGVYYGQREVLMNLVMTHAGAVFGEHNDLVQALTPLPEHTGPAELQLDRFTDLVLDAQFEDGATGPLYEYELIYYPLSTDDGTAEGYKLPQPDSVVGTAITDLGDDGEAYRWNFLLQNNEDADDYGPLIALGQTFALSGGAFLAEVDGVIDVDEWLRAYAFATLSGAVDNYGGDSSQHNACFYVRPEDGRVLYFPHDLDFIGSSSMAIVGNSDLARLLVDPANLRAYYGHLADIIGTSYNRDHLAPWCAQLGELLPDQDFDGNCAFIYARADYVMSGASDSVAAVFPDVDFAITTNGGADFSVAAAEVTLEGTAWIDVRQISLEGAEEPLALSWTDDTTWAVTVPLEAGANTVVLVATDHHGAVVGTDSIGVTSTGG